MTQPFFSVIIPAYDRAAVLGAAIASVRAQSCQDFEIIVVDDGSCDNPRAVVDAIGDPRVHFISQANQGGGAARNRAIDEARGRFIAPLDSDDAFLPHHLETMKALLGAKPGTVGYARVLVDRGAGRRFLKPPRAIGADEDMAEYLLCARGFVPTITIVVPRELAAKTRYHTNLRVAEDTDFAIRLARTGVRFKMAELPGAVWNDRQDPKRASADQNASRLGAWLDEIKPRISRKAWLGGRGWAYAKLVGRRNKLAALGLYARALLAGCYRPRLAIVVLLQVLLSNSAYRFLADRAIDWFHVGLHEKNSDTGARSLKSA